MLAVPPRQLLGNSKLYRLRALRQRHGNVCARLDLVRSVHGRILLQPGSRRVRCVPRQLHLCPRLGREAPVDVRVRQQLLNAGLGRRAHMHSEHGPALPPRVDDERDVSVHAVRSGLLLDHRQRAHVRAMPRWKLLSRKCDWVYKVSRWQLDRRGRLALVRLLRGQLLLQRGAGAVRRLPEQLDLVGGHKRQLTSNVHMRSRVRKHRLWRQARVHVSRRVDRE